ncbi:hypothetical protein [Halococcus agarilyticus]|nr:hypothetical protein [Halococcus agarilyticus]
MPSDPAAAAAETPCPECGSLQAELTPAADLEYECWDCGEGFDLPRIG